MTRLGPILVALPLLAVAACSRSDSVDSTVGPTSPETTSATSAPPVESTISSTTTTVADTSTTVADTTTTTLDTTTTVARPTTTVFEGPAPDAPATAFVADATRLVEIDVATGEVDRVIDEQFNGDGVFRGELRLSTDGATIWFSEGYEDGWYGCDSSVGSFGRVDVASGAVEVVGAGVGPEPSPDGTLVAYITSELCLPDPENPELWVLTPYDRVVVRDLATGDEREFVTDTPPDDDDSPSRIEWAGFRPNGRLLVLTNDGALRLVDLDGSAVLQDHPVIAGDIRGVPVGATPGGALVTVELGDEGSADLYSVDVGSGAAALLATSDGFVTAGVAPSGAVLVSGFVDVEVVPGAPVTVLVAPDDTTYYDVDW